MLAIDDKEEFFGKNQCGFCGIWRKLAEFGGFWRNLAEECGGIWRKVRGEVWEGTSILNEKDSGVIFLSTS